mmetsp:Transcript_23455/g.66771  ORF Transcript_23455/g.66771 Transcript_23455/m.66771 type:complete len:273 (-) Transcript_23455:244-1062(-)
MLASLDRHTTGSPTAFNSSSLSMYATLVASKLSYNQSSAFVRSAWNASRSSLEMNSPYSPLEDVLSRMLKMYDSTSLRLSSVSMMSFISTCIAVSASMSFCNASGLMPTMPEGTTEMSVFFVRFFVFLTSTHSYFFSGSWSFFSAAGLPSPSFFSACGLPSSFFSLLGLPSGLSDGSFFSSPSGLASSSAGLLSAGISLFSLTISSTSSSSTSWALSSVKMPCKVSFARTNTFLAASEAGRSILKVPNSLGVPGKSASGFSYSALMSKGPFL